MDLNTHSILLDDPLLQPYAGEIARRSERLWETKCRLMPEGGKLQDFANGHLYFGLHPTPDGWVYREWAPNAKAVSLFGDFNGWQRGEHQMQPLANGQWELHIPGRDTLRHGGKLRIEIDTGNERLERIPSYITRVVQNPDTLSFDGQLWAPEKPYKWVFTGYKRSPQEPPLIYECHTGMSGEGKGIASFRDFTGNVLPRAHALGYNAIQLMAVMEHPYYGSFGYQVSNFFAVSSRFGTPDDLKSLVDTAHGYGMAVILDVVHSHAARNEIEGLGRFDGTVHQFFHDGTRGEHPQWGTRLFNYSSPGVLHFLLSNLKYWMDEYHFDGFRFDGITSMLYNDHGLGHGFASYADYFGANTDNDAVAYLQLASELCHSLNPDCLLIAEDSSGMPGLCRPIAEGGIGFDYRLGMNMPDYWVRTLRYPDEQWSMGELWQQLNNRRQGEKVVGYTECHDQAMVGEKTLMFRLADSDMYWDMDKRSSNPHISRAVALHKLIRLVTFAAAGEGYLTFMGNEFGHPDWIDFPREGNGFSYNHAQRLWSLADSPALYYHDLRSFEKAMLPLAEGGLLDTPARLVLLDESAKLLAFQRGELVFVFNFHPTQQATAHLPLRPQTRLEAVLATEWDVFGGSQTKAEGLLANELPPVLLTPRSAVVYREYPVPPHS